MCKYQPCRLSAGSMLIVQENVPDPSVHCRPVQVGPRKSFATAWSANAVSICASCGLGKVTRLEASRRFRLQSAQPLPSEAVAAFAALVHDRMTEEVWCCTPPALDFQKELTPL